MTPRVKVQRPAVQIGLILDVARNDHLEAGRASLAGTLTGPDARGVGVALEIARPKHPSNALVDLFFGHVRLRRLYQCGRSRRRAATWHDTAFESTDQGALSLVETD